MNCAENLLFCEFQFTPLREGRLLKPSFAVNPIIFQFTPLREGRQCAKVKISQHGHFNSRPCVRGDMTEQMEKMYGSISIHAPA